MLNYKNKYQKNIDKYINLICDKKTTKFHVKAKDYFASLSTILNLLSQSNTLTEKEIKNILKSLSQDLLYLQDNYKIEKKTEKTS
ncbi:MAG: hypothetical protein ACLFNO_03050 [Parcubacteria group bacterium]